MKLFTIYPYESPQTSGWEQVFKAGGDEGNFSANNGLRSYGENGTTAKFGKTSGNQLMFWERLVMEYSLEQIGTKHSYHINCFKEQVTVIPNQH